MFICMASSIAPIKTTGKPIDFNTRAIIKNTTEIEKAKKEQEYLLF